MCNIAKLGATHKLYSIEMSTSHNNEIKVNFFIFFLNFTSIHNAKKKKKPTSIYVLLLFAKLGCSVHGNKPLIKLGFSLEIESLPEC